MTEPDPRRAARTLPRRRSTSRASSAPFARSSRRSARTPTATGSSGRRSASRTCTRRSSRGSDEDPAQHLTVTFEADHDEMVMVRDIPLHSLCEHHLCPFAGRAHVAYIPGDDGRITGLSKIARLVDGLRQAPAGPGAADDPDRRRARRGAEARGRVRDGRGRALLHVDARREEARRSLTITSAVRGLFKTNPATRAEALSLVTHPGNRL